MSNYTKTTNFAAKDSLPSGNANKIVKGTEIDTEFDNIATASATKADIAGPTFTGTVTIPTVDLNGGAIDGTTVGASTAAAITGTTIVANTSINIAGDGATVTGIKDEDDMSSDSATKLATQQSIKAYVDSQVTAQDLDFQADSGGALSIDLDSETLTFTGGTGVDTSGSGNAVTFAIDSTVATLTGSQTLTNKTLTAPTISGNLTTDGNIDGRDVATDGTKLDGIEASADVTDTANVTAAGALMDSEVTNLAQVKAFDSSDYATAAQGTTADSALQNVVEDTTPQLGGDLASNGNDILFGDNDKAIFGAGSDLQIYHDASDSVILDNGTGNLKIQANDLVLKNADGSKEYLKGTNGGSVRVRHNNTTVLETTSTGIDVTGTVTADGLTVDGTVDGTAVALLRADNTGVTKKNTLRFEDTDTTTQNDQQIGRIEFYSNDTDHTGVDAVIEAVSATSGLKELRFLTSNTANTPLSRLDIAKNGDISFYEDTGSTPKMVWSSSAESLGIGTSSPNDKVDISGSTGDGYRLTDGTHTGVYRSISGGTILKTTSNHALLFGTNDTERMRILSTGGITFNGDTAQANALDDYEEGTFTMSLHDAASGGNQSSTSKTAYYTKIGNQVTVYAHALNNIDTTGMTAGNSLYFALPFTSSSTGRAVGSVIHHGFTYDGDSENEDMKPYVATNNSRGLFATVGYGRADGSVKVSDVSSGVDDIHTFTLTYFV